jgi:hypothetical protein
VKRREENAPARRRAAAARLWKGSLILVAAASLSACRGTPEALDGDPGPLPEIGPIPAPRHPARTPAAHRAGAPGALSVHQEGTLETASAKAGGEVFFNVTNQGGTESTRAPAASPVARPEERITLLAGLLDEEIIGELASRYAREWTILSGGIGSPAKEEFDPRLEEAAKRLIIVGLLRPGRAAGEAEPLGEALTFAMAAERSVEHRLIAAAYLEGAGRTDEARAILQELWAGAPEDGKADPQAQSTFAVEGLAFATSIEGPGIYTPTPASQVAAGNMVLVYGEFRNFRSVPQAEGPEGPSYARAFSASLRLLSSTGAEIDRLDFLPEARGRQMAKDAVDNVNFWARYRIPARLESGKYTLVIEARDVLGGASASGELEFDL